MINGIYDDVKDMQFAQEMRGETSEQAQGQEVSRLVMLRKVCLDSGVSFELTHSAG